MDSQEKAVRFWTDKFFETKQSHDEHLYAKEYLYNFYK